MFNHATEQGCQKGNLRIAALSAALFADDTYLNRMVVLVDNSGEPAIALPSAQTDIPYGKLVLDGEEQVEVMFLDPCVNTNLVLKGTCVPGDTLVLADPTTAGDEGKVEVGATGYVIGIAEEAGEDGQWIKVRPLGVKL